MPVVDFLTLNQCAILITVLLVSYISKWGREVASDGLKSIPFLAIFHVSAFLCFITEESILFIGVFWLCNHLIISPWTNFLEGSVGAGSYASWGVSAILSNAAAQLSVFVILYFCGASPAVIGTAVLATCFILLQSIEMKLSSCNFGDEWNVFFLVTGLHFSHVLVGCIFLGCKTIVSNLHSSSCSMINSVSHSVELILLYWHLVEGLWIGVLLHLFF